MDSSQYLDFPSWPGTTEQKSCRSQNGLIPGKKKNAYCPLHAGTCTPPKYLLAHTQAGTQFGGIQLLLVSQPSWGEGVAAAGINTDPTCSNFPALSSGRESPPGGSSKSYDSVSLASALGEAVLCFVVLGCHGLASFLLGFDCLPFRVTAGHAPAPEPVAPTVLRVYLGDDAPD